MTSGWVRLRAHRSYHRIMGHGRGPLSEDLQIKVASNLTFLNQHSSSSSKLTMANILSPTRPIKPISGVLESSHRALSIRVVISSIGRRSTDRLRQKRV